MGGSLDRQPYIYDYHGGMRKLELEKEIWLKKHDSIENVVEDIKDNSATLDSALIRKHALVVRNYLLKN